MRIPDSLLKHIEAELEPSQGLPMKLMPEKPVAGGDINDTWVLRTDSQRFFLKLNRASLGEMFRTEAYALRIIERSQAIRCPRVFAHGTHGGKAWLLMEYLDLQTSGDAASLGDKVANMHRKIDKCYGWPEDNFIGRTPQKNRESHSWSEFWLNNRLGPQLRMVADKGFATEFSGVQSELLKATENLLQNHQPEASLLHGDLWSGNKAWLANSEPAIYDPASYYGDREADIAMTELFGNFGAEFYRAYNTNWPLNADYERRKPLYNLYHMLNHLNLFGSGYLGSSLALAKQVISEGL